MRTTTLNPRQSTRPATVTDITARRAGRPPLEPAFITEEIREGALVAFFRDDLNMTQAELAYKSGVARSTLAQYEKGFKRIPDERVLALADALGVKPWYIRIIQTLPLNLKAA